MFRVLSYLTICLSLLHVVYAASRTSPPAGAKIVRAGTTNSGEFSTVSAAVNSLPNDSSSQSIFIYPGTYTEQVSITRSGPLTIYGYTTDTSTYKNNQATIQFGLDAVRAGSDDASGTVRIHKDNFSMYNVNVKNTFGVGSQAIALSQYGNRVGIYACGLYGYQDTVLAEQGAQVYLRGYIEGATDFIFGQRGQAYFGGNTIGVKGAGWVTASGRSSDDSTSYVFNENTIVTASGAFSNATSRQYFGRPWSSEAINTYKLSGTCTDNPLSAFVDYAKVIFKNTVVTAPFNTALWSEWSTSTPNTDHVFFADYNTSGGGVSGAARPSFATVLSASQAAAYTISSAVGSDYTSWVDASYVV